VPITDSTLDAGSACFADHLAVILNHKSVIGSMSTLYLNTLTVESSKEDLSFLREIACRRENFCGIRGSMARAHSTSNWSFPAISPLVSVRVAYIQIILALAMKALPGTWFHAALG